ncbi:MAG: hypothetical protein EHM58_07590 [Ignavibacteriae bacterium]|nr:MAG: hypothetical protein EHM58_07590 [Ignavibacteriota bacterium]
MINLVSAILLILFAAFSRLMPHPANFAPVAAIALFSAVHLNNKKLAFIVPLAAMLISNLFLGFYAGMEWVYGAFAVIVLVGYWLKGRMENSKGGKKLAYLFGTTAAASIIFFIISNFGVWMTGTMYALTFDGLVLCYTMAIPFYRNSLAGDLFYVTVMFGIYALVTRYAKTPVLVKNK